MTLLSNHRQPSYFSAEGALTTPKAFNFERMPNLNV